MTEKERSPDYFANLEGNAVPLIGPSRLRKKVASAPAMPADLVASGDKALALGSVQTAVLEALLAAGYGRKLAELMAQKLAKELPAVQEKAEAETHAAA